MALRSKIQKFEQPYSARNDLQDGRLNMSQMGGVVLGAIERFRRLLTGNLQDAQDSEMPKLKQRLITSVAELLDFEEVPTGLILNSGSDANNKAMFLAREITGRRKVLSSNLSHRSVAQAAKVMDMTCIKLDARPDLGFQVPKAKLLEVLERQGSEIAMLHITTGQTDLGIVEELDPEIAALCQELGIWVHADAAYGSFNLGLLRKDIKSSSQVSGVIHSRAIRSITVDPHKFIGPVGCGILLLPQLSNPEVLSDDVKYFKSTASGLEGTTSSAFIPKLAQEEMDRLGRDGLERLAQICAANARYLHLQLRQRGIKTLLPNNVSTMVPIQLNSREEAEKIHEILLQDGLSVNFIHITGDDYQIHGIRLIIRPELRYDKTTLEHVAFLVKRAIENARGKNYESEVVFEDLFGTVTAAQMFNRTLGPF